MLNRRVDVDLGSIPADEDEAKLVIVLGDQERRESVYLGDELLLNYQHRRLLLLHRYSCRTIVFIFPPPSSSTESQFALVIWFPRMTKVTQGENCRRDESVQLRWKILT